jgi:hypothetical protein
MRSWGAMPPSFSAQGPDFLHGAPPRAACAAFFKESRMMYANASKLGRNGGTLWANLGHPSYSSRPCDDADSSGTEFVSEVLTQGLMKHSQC